MKIDRTWTITFEGNELNLLSEELQLIQMPEDLGRRPLLMQVATSKQITLPLRAIERLALELSIIRSRFGDQNSQKGYHKRFPQLTTLTSEIDSILYSFSRKSA